MRSARLLEMMEVTVGIIVAANFRCAIRTAHGCYSRLHLPTDTGDRVRSMPGYSVMGALRVATILGLVLACSVATASASRGTANMQRPCSATHFDTAGSLTKAAKAVECDVTRRQLVIVSDYHGSNEIPDFVAQLVSDASARRPVRLGLEIEAFEQKPIQTYVASHGTAVDRAALLHDGFWSTGQGRTSQAIVRLIEQAGKLREQGRDVDVFTTVPEYPGDAAIEQAGGGDAFRSAAMAQTIHNELQQAAHHSLVIAFMGSAHSAYTGPGRGKDATVTDRLLADSPYLVNIELHGGSVWDCQARDCGPHPLPSEAAHPGNAGVLGKSPVRPGEPVLVTLQLPPLTPSPPAKQKMPKP